MNDSFRFHDRRFGGYSHQFKLKKKHSYYGGKAHWPGKPRPGKPLWVAVMGTGITTTVTESRRASSWCGAPRVVVDD